MARLVVIYKTPRDAAAFDCHYVTTHVPLAKRIPGLTNYEISKGPVLTPNGTSNVHLVAILHFETLTALQAGLATPEGKATADDLKNFAGAGVVLYFFDDMAA